MKCGLDNIIWNEIVYTEWTVTRLRCHIFFCPIRYSRNWLLACLFVYLFLLTRDRLNESPSIFLAPVPNLFDVTSFFIHSHLRNRFFFCFSSQLKLFSPYRLTLTTIYSRFTFSIHSPKKAFFSIFSFCRTNEEFIIISPDLNYL